jgi:outer membrane protein assembly factor BamB
MTSLPLVRGHGIRGLGRPLVASLLAIAGFVASAQRDGLGGATEGKDWPCWRGADGSGSASSGTELIEDISKAKLLWKSESLPGSYGAAIQTGENGPIVADNKVFLVYHDPNDEVYDDQDYDGYMKGFPQRLLGGSETVDRYNKGEPQAREQVAKKKASITVDDVVLCMDADTGKTLWKTAFAKQGFNYMNFGRYHWNSAKTGPNVTPCFHQGKVFALGNAGKVYALEAASGKMLWESDIGDHYAKASALIKECREKRSRKAGNRAGLFDRYDLATGPIVAGDILVVYDERGGLIGFAPATGKKLWTTKGTFCAYHSAPVRWLSQGKEYVVAYGGTKGTCVDPANGKILWEVSVPYAREPGTACVSDKYAVFGRTCFLITPEKATELWTCSDKVGISMAFVTPAIIRDRVFFGHGSMTMLELSTGKILGQSADMFLSIGSSVVGGDDRAFKEFGRDAGSAMVMAVARADGFAGKVTMLSLPHYAMSSTPCYAAGRLYLRMQNAIVCYDLQGTVEPKVSAAAALSDKTQAARALADLCGDASSRVRGQALSLLAQMGKDAQPAVLSVLALFAKPDLYDDAELVRTIVAVSPTIDALLTDSLKNADARIRMGVVSAIGAIGEPRDRALATLAGMAADDADLGVRATALESMAKLKAPATQITGAALKLLDHALTAKRGRPFGQALTVLRENGQMPSAQPAILQALAMPDDVFVNAALRELPNLPETKASPAAPLLMTLLKSDRRELWAPAAGFLVKCAPETHTKMASILGERIRAGKPDTAKPALEHLGNLGRNTKDNALRTRILNDIAAVVGGAVNELKIPAIEQLGAFGPSAKPVVKCLHAAADNASLKTAAEAALERINPPDADNALPALDNLLGD